MVSPAIDMLSVFITPWMKPIVIHCATVSYTHLDVYKRQALVLAGENPDEATLAAIRAQYHLDQPLIVQYLYWLKGVATGDLGESMRHNRPVLDLILLKLPVTLQLAVMGICIALVVGISAGVISALRHNSKMCIRDRMITDALCQGYGTAGKTGAR